jgi:Heterokaryon incompatibility protein (HET)
MLVDESVVEITANLEDAIRHFKQELEPVAVWADALCINQEDISEKNQ